MLVTVTTEDGKSSQMEAAPGKPSLEDPKTLEPHAVLEFSQKNPQLLKQLHHIDDVSPLDGIHSAVCGQFTLTENQVSRYPIELHCVLNRSERGRQREIVKHARAPLRCERLDPGLAQAVETGEVVKVRTCVMMKQMSSHKAKWTEQKERAALLANLDSEESQAKIAQIIQQEAIDQNYTMAMEEAPDMFARIMMLYIDTEVVAARQSDVEACLTVPHLINGERVKAFVDSSAQSTIMSAACAERCGLMRLVDRHFHGESRGVGTGKILGRIHMAHIKIGPHHFPCSFTILERSNVDLLFGLDMLKRHLCAIDLKNGVLASGSAGTTVPFLSEKDLPSSAKETKAENVERKLSLEASSASSPASASVASSGPTPSPAAAAVPAPAPAPAATSAGTSGGGAAAVLSDEAKVLQLVGMGFSRQAAETVLASTGGGRGARGGAVAGANGDVAKDCRGSFGA